jgi:hypothetical protein
VIVGVDDETIAEWIHTRRIVATAAGTETDAQSLAAEIGLIKAIKEWDLHRIITFHNRVERAKRFSNELKEVVQWLGDGHKPAKALWSEHVCGRMPTFDRRTLLKRLKAVGKVKSGFSQTRCLSEGVDVPALDGVAFIDARSSEIDIIQAVGRAIRLSAKKQKGTIVIPVFIERHEDPEEAVKSSNFEPIWDVLDALKAHDDLLSCQLDQLRIELGAGKRSKVGERDLSKVVLDLPTAVGAEFAQALRTQLVMETTESWMFWYGLLQAYVREHDHCEVPHEYVTPTGYRLGGWVDKQRQRQDGMSRERRAYLDALGFVWAPHVSQWEEGFQHLEMYAKKHGDCRVAFDYVSVGGFPLGSWVNTQRINEASISPERKARLNALDFIWDALGSKWEKGFHHLQEFLRERDHCNVPYSYIAPDGFRLGAWVNKQRQKRNTMLVERKARLNALGFIFDPREAAWEEGFQYLQDYAKEHGNCMVHDTHVTADKYRLGQWVRVQRKRQRQNKMPADQKDRLDALGFVWDVLAVEWEEGFQHMEAYVKEHEHCRVLATHITADGYRLGQWVKVQRRRRKNNKMPAEQKDRLDALGFVWLTRNGAGSPSTVSGTGLKFTNGKRPRTRLKDLTA